MTCNREPWSLPAPSNDNTSSADRASQLFGLGFIVGGIFGSGVGGAVLLIGIYVLHLL